MQLLHPHAVAEIYFHQKYKNANNSKQEQIQYNQWLLPIKRDMTMHYNIHLVVSSWLECTSKQIFEHRSVLLFCFLTKIPMK